MIGATALRGEPFRQRLSIPGFVDSAALLHASGLYVVDLSSGEIVHAMLMTGMNGIYDVAFVPDIKRPLVAKIDADAEETARWTTFAPFLSAERAAGEPS